MLPQAGPGPALGQKRGTPKVVSTLTWPTPSDQPLPTQPFGLLEL